MVGQAVAPEYRGSLGNMSVNTSYEEVLRQAQLRTQRAEDNVELAQARLAEAEASRRLGMLAAAEIAWRSSYRTARDEADWAGMAWALWSGGTLARQRGRSGLALRWLHCGVDLARRGSDATAAGYLRAGIAETIRIQGDYERARPLHVDLLAEARQQGKCRHIVWALEGLAQIERHEGNQGAAWRLFEEAHDLAEQGQDDRGQAWALRGMADLLSVNGEPDAALSLLSRGESLCHDMNLSVALAYNRKMRGNVLFRVCRYEDAAHTYRDAYDRFEDLGEPRGQLLARLGKLKSDAKLGRPRQEIDDELVALRREAELHELPGMRRLIEAAREESQAV